MTVHATTTFPGICGILLAVAARAAAQDTVSTDELAKRLTYMKDSTQVYEFTTGVNNAETLKLVPDAALRWTNPVTGLKDGTLFFWTSDDGRPYAAAQVFLIDSGIWLHEFQSLTTASFRATRDGKTVWNPSKAGVEWKPVPSAPAPAKGGALRLSQMKAMIERFSASDDFEGASRWELRPLTRPLLRYSSPGHHIIDGAVFAFVVTTDPEVFVTLEAKSSDGKDDAWYYSLAPMTAYALKVSLDDKVVWEKPWTKEPIPITDPYRIVVYKP